MEMKQIDAAATIARRFLVTVDRLKQVANKDPHWDIMGRKESGALRRASMDLTRALAEMRRP